MTHPYLVWLILFLFLPSIIVWLVWGSYLKQYKKLFIGITMVSLVWGFCFDLAENAFFHIWNYSNTVGVWFLGLPIEEYVLLLFLPQMLISILLVLRKKIYE